MDTRFWGPSGWKMLHLITFNYTYSAETAITYSKFFETLPYILPCKYCRSSLSDYYKEHPFQIPGGIYLNTNKAPFQNGKGVMNPVLNIERWLYTIHNSVNKKLKQQGLQNNPTPSFAQVTIYYTRLKKSPWYEQLALFWDFLFAVGYNHPKQTPSKPMPDCPKGIKTCRDKTELNKWNVLPLDDRMKWYNRFWISLPVILPHEIAKRWAIVEKQHQPTLESRRSTLAWLWRMRCGLDVDFKDPYTSVCKKIAAYSSDCGRSKYGKTCRKHRTRSQKTVKKTMKKTT